MILTLADLKIEHLGLKISFESYGIEHTGLLNDFKITKAGRYELASKEYLHHHCQIEIINQSFNCDTKIIYTSLPKHTHVRLHLPDEE